MWDSAPAEPVTFFFDGRYRADAASFSPSDKENIILLRDPLRITLSVLDAQTDAPIPMFTYTLGQGTPENPTWWSSPSRPCYDGTTQFTDTASREIVRVDAPDYPRMIQSLPRQLDQATITFRLSKSADIGITLFTSDGNPAADVSIQLVTAPSYFFCGPDITDAETSGGNPGRTFLTDDRGHCRLLGLPDAKSKPAHLLVSTDAGVLNISTADLHDGATLKLLPWAHVHGITKQGPNLALKDKIQLSPQTSQSPADAPAISFTFTAITSRDGTFDFPTVPPVPFTVYRTLEIYPNAIALCTKRTAAGSNPTN